MDNTDEESHKGCFLKADVHYPKKLHYLHNDLPFLAEKIKNKKVEKLVANLHDKTEYFIHSSIVVEGRVSRHFYFPFSQILKRKMHRSNF